MAAAQMQKELKVILARPENARCADCGTQAPTWASINLGVFVCIECSGVHRHMGTGVSKVRSVTMDAWQPEWVSHMASVGNLRANLALEASLPPSHRLSNNATRTERESFLRSKYQRKEWKGAPTPASTAAVRSHLGLPEEAAPINSTSPAKPSGPKAVNPAVARRLARLGRTAATSASPPVQEGGGDEGGDLLGLGGGSAPPAPPSSSGFSFVSGGQGGSAPSAAGGSGFAFVSGSPTHEPAAPAPPGASDDLFSLTPTAPAPAPVGPPPGLHAARRRSASGDLLSLGLGEGGAGRIAAMAAAAEASLGAGPSPPATPVGDSAGDLADVILASDPLQRVAMVNNGVGGVSAQLEAVRALMRAATDRVLGAVRGGALVGVVPPSPAPTARVASVASDGSSGFTFM